MGWVAAVAEGRASAMSLMTPQRDLSLDSADESPGGGSAEDNHIAAIQRGRIVRAVVDVAAARGAARASVDRVCKEAGVSRATFYEQFGDREAAILAAFNWGAERAAAMVRRRVAAAEGWRETVREGLAELLALFDSDPALARMLVVEAPACGPAVIAARAEMAAGLERVIDQGRQAEGSTEDPPDTAATGTVGAVFFVIHARVAERSAERLSELLGALMSLIVLPYLGADAAREELARPLPESPVVPVAVPTRAESMADLGLRLTHRTVRCLAFIAAHPGSSNREVADGAGVRDQGQMSKLLQRLESLGLIEDRGAGRRARRLRRSWRITQRGAGLVEAIRADSEQWLP
jgi:AcrR family transcriptional regulator/DNA-binding MarR family transcriptional regulator